MGVLMGLLVAGVIAGGLVVRHWHRYDRIARLRDQARLRVIEGQLAALRAALRIGASEHETRQALRDELRQVDFYRNSTEHEEYRPSWALFRVPDKAHYPEAGIMPGTAAKAVIGKG
jgi:hypothetical protein